MVAPNARVRRSIGIVAQNAWCKFEKFRSKIATSKSSPRCEKRGAHRTQAFRRGRVAKKGVGSDVRIVKKHDAQGRQIYRIVAALWKYEGF